MTALHDGPGHQADIFATGTAAQNAGTRLEAEWLADNATPWAGESAAPAGPFQVGGAGRIVGKNTLKVRQRLRERQVFKGQDIHGQH